VEVSVQPRPLQLYPQDRTSVTIEQKAGWAPQGRSGRFEEINLLALPGFELRIVQLVAQSLYEFEIEGTQYIRHDGTILVAQWTWCSGYITRYMVCSPS
jgi:hypothetical protein